MKGILHSGELVPIYRGRKLSGSCFCEIKHVVVPYIKISVIDQFLNICPVTLEEFLTKNINCGEKICMVTSFEL